VISAIGSGADALTSGGANDVANGAGFSTTVLSSSGGKLVNQSPQPQVEVNALNQPLWDF
jgi:hypothetical protein